MMQQKRKVVDNVRGRFARFGDEVLSMVLAFALQPRSMPVLLERLNIRPSGNLDAQLDAVWEYIARTSGKDFIKHVKRTRKRDVEAFDIDKMLESASNMKIPDDTADDDVPGHDAREIAGDSPPETEEPAGVGTAGNGPAEYLGAERRQGKDRRKREERRNDIEAINRNRRFGGERRRRPRGRRKTD